MENVNVIGLGLSKIHGVVRAAGYLDRVVQYHAVNNQCTLVCAGAFDAALIERAFERAYPGCASRS